MAGPLLNVIFLGAAAVGFIPITNSFVKEAQGPQYKVTIGVASNIDKAASLSGNVPGVSLWTVEGESIGGVFGTKQVLPQASAFDIHVTGNQSLGLGKAPAEYLSVTNGGIDAICISYIGFVDPLDNKRLFVGDVAKNCGADWFPSDLLVGNQRPPCFWLDRDSSNGIRFQGVGIHLPSFSNAEEGSIKGLAAEYKKDSDTMCKSGPRFRMYQNLRAEDQILRFDPPLQATNFTPDGADVDTSKIVDNAGVLTEINLELANIACASKDGCPNIADQIFGPGVGLGRGQHRSLSDDGVRATNDTATDRSFAKSLVVSHYAEHSAEDVCGSETSRGPDFVSMKESKYCDMETKTAWDLCSNSTIICCFDLNNHQTRPCQVRGAVVARKAQSRKSYHEVRHWGKS